MNFGFTEEQELLRKTARDFLAERSPMSRVRQALEGDASFSKTLWGEVAQLGWTGLMLPEDQGGAGLSIVELCIVLEELGRSLPPIPFLSTAIAACALLEHGDAAQRDRWLPRLASGEAIGAFAAESAPGDGLAVADTGDGVRVRGRLSWVPDAAGADLLVAIGRRTDETPVLLALPCASEGLHVEPLTSMDSLRPACRVDFDAVRLPRDGVLAAEGSHAARAVDRALVMLSAEMVGGAEACLEASVAYAKERIQFGRPIGVHQAIKHKCANMLFALESARSITYYAAWAAREQAPDAALSAAMAKATASEAFRDAAQENLQIHGGVGFTWEYDCHLYLKRAKTDEAWLGDAEAQRRHIADLLSL